MITVDDVRAAAARLDGVAHRTPVLHSRTLDARTGASVYLKAECLQRGGAFKFRGAYNMISALPAEARRAAWRPLVGKPRPGGRDRGRDARIDRRDPDAG